MTTLYKLTDQNGMTQNDTQWGAGVEHTADGKSAELCNEHWLHAYEHPLIAVLMNPAHACIDRPRMWECDGDIGLRDGVLKCGCTRLRTIRKIPVPKLTTEQLIEIAIWIASEVYDYPAWVQWAQGWLTSKDRSYAAAHAAAYAAYAAAHAADAAAYAAYAAYAAAHAADAAAYAADAAHAAAYVDIVGIIEAVVGEGMEKS